MRKNVYPVALLLLLWIPSACQREKAVSEQPAVSERAAAPPAAPAPTAAVVTVRMHLDGLCTIATASVANETAKQTVILAKQRDHDANFIVHKDNLPSTTGFSQVADENGNPTNYYAYHLDGVQIELDADTGAWDGGTEVAYSDAGDSTNETYPELTGPSENKSSIHWIPSMQSVLGLNTPPAVRNQFVKEEPSKNDVLARMPLRGGTLASLLNKPYWLWSFRTVAGQYKQVQVVADEIHYAFPLKNGVREFSVYGRPFVTSGSPGAPMALFKIKTATNSATEIPIYLTNIPARTFTLRPTIAIGHKDPHFHQHYRLLQGTPPMFEPVVIGRMEPAAPPIGTTVYCGPDRLP